MAGNSTDRKAIKAKKDQERRDRVTNDLVVRTLMSQQEGRRYVWLKLAEGNIFSSTICFGEDGFARTAFLEGKRSVAIGLLADCMRISAANFVLMMQENSRIDNGGPSSISGGTSQRSPDGGTGPDAGSNEPGSESNPFDADAADDPVERFASANVSGPSDSSGDDLDTQGSF